MHEDTKSKVAFVYKMTLRLEYVTRRPRIAQFKTVLDDHKSQQFSR